MLNIAIDCCISRNCLTQLEFEKKLGRRFRVTNAKIGDILNQQHLTIRGDKDHQYVPDEIFFCVFGSKSCVY